MTQTSAPAARVPSQAVQAAAAKLLLTGAVTIVAVSGSRATASSRTEATVTSGANLYRVTETAGVWYCTCPAYTAQCKHIVAVQAVR